MFQNRKRLYFILIVTITFFFPLMVNAKTTCVYKWKQKTPANTGTDRTTVLWTEDSDTKLTGKQTNDLSLEFANKIHKGIYLNDDGSCPSVSFYTKNHKTRIYKGNNCKDSTKLSDKQKKYCSDAISGTIDNSDRSTNNLSGAHSQYSLTNSSASSCTYEGTYDKLSTKFTIESKSSNKITGSCTQTKTNGKKAKGCTLSTSSKANKFYSNKKFTCPKYIYVGSKVIANSSRQNYVLKDVGGENDTNTTGQNQFERQGLNADGSKKYTSNATLDGLNQKYDSCSQLIDTQTEGSFGWLLQKLLNYIKIAGPILVVLLSALDFIKAVASSEEDAFKKAQSRLVIRLVAALALFLVPTFVELLLGLINGINDPTCGLK